MSKTYTIRVQSPFILTQAVAKRKLGAGFKILEVNTERDDHIPIVDVDSAVKAILKTGYRALARANHPDLGGDTETMVILNRAKKELTDLLSQVVEGMEKTNEDIESK
jgi:hypothetical protein